jgi:hypothetical protein
MDVRLELLTKAFHFFLKKRAAGSEGPKALSSPLASSGTPSLTKPPVGSTSAAVPGAVSDTETFRAPALFSRSAGRRAANGRAAMPMEASSMSNSAPTLDQVSEAVLEVLKSYLPAGAPPLPLSSVMIASINERSAGLGNRVGEDRRGALTVQVLKSLRVEAVARFQLWASGAGAVEEATRELVARLLADRDELRSVDNDGDGREDLQILRLALKGIGASEHIPSDGVWRQSAEFSLLAEFPYTDADDAQSLITRIPIGIDSAFSQSTIVTDEMTRWDDDSAPSLMARGPLSTGRLSALVFIPGAMPSGTVTLLRTFEGSAAAPADHSNLNSFLAAITDPSNPERNGRVVLASVAALLAAFSDAGDPVTLGDWDEDGLTDSYQPKALIIDPPLRLARGERVEISFEHANFDQTAVVYLRAAHRLAN